MPSSRGRRIVRSLTSSTPFEVFVYTVSGRIDVSNAGIPSFNVTPQRLIIISEGDTNQPVVACIAMNIAAD
jgi:hypothetical protein